MLTILSKVIMYTKVTRGALFMEQKLKFRLVLGLLAVLKKNGANDELLLWAFFHVSKGRIICFFF